MKKILLLLIFSILLFAKDATPLNNPKVYSSLGDVIYNNLPKIQALKQLQEFKNFTNKIDEYTLNVQKAKKFGFEIESGNKIKLKIDYLNEIRKLNKVNEYFKKIIKIRLN